MDRMLYVAMNGAKGTLLQQGTNNNNLANLNTTGFRADYDTFVSQSVGGAGHDTRNYSTYFSAGVSQSSGSLFTTGRDLDIAIKGEGYIAVQDNKGGEAYTRAGDLKIGSGGILQTQSGNLVLGNAGPIAIPPYTKLQIGEDGTISIQGVGQSTSELAEVDRIKLVTISNAKMKKDLNGLLLPSEGGEAIVDGTVSVTSGALETSNVNPVDSLVNMISLARQFEIQVKLMKAAEENEVASAKLLKMQ
ncbi:flagellar biosynthesis protein FlgF [Chromatiales bacterium (ex Bugula neritina AB1)]|nr:flagellar biosynthesis protein FlgF [Chromatiales bacterium (ex Bugula neritina AB1)]